MALISRSARGARDFSGKCKDGAIRCYSSSFAQIRILEAGCRATKKRTARSEHQFLAQVIWHSAECRKQPSCPISPSAFRRSGALCLDAPSLRRRAKREANHAPKATLRVSGTPTAISTRIADSRAR